MKRLIVLVLTLIAFNIGNVYAGPTESKTDDDDTASGVQPIIHEHPKKESFQNYMENGGMLGFFGANLNPLFQGLGWSPEKNCRLVTNVSGEHLQAFVSIAKPWSTSGRAGEVK